MQGSGGHFRAVAAASGSVVEPEFGLMTVDELAQATEAAAQAYPLYRATSPQQRSAFLETIAQEIQKRSGQIIARAVLESGLPEARIIGELGRTTGQLRLFAGVARLGDHLGVRIDPALPQRQPLPRPDLRLRMIPVGPVAVFGASNFPLAFSVAGGDTASALAAGCPVVVKGHPAHPGTGALVAEAIASAVAECALPTGTFSFVLGQGNEFGQALVSDPSIKAVGFTGSRGGGLALVAAAASRPEPIPVYAEMSSINPVIVLPGALASRDVDELAREFVASLTLGAGQFCTNPGLVFVPTGADGDTFVEAAAAHVEASTGQMMLTPGIEAAYNAGVDALDQASGVTRVATGKPGSSAGAPAPVLSTADEPAGSAVAEVFGASSVVIRYPDAAQLRARLALMEGQLTATIQYAPADAQLARELLPVLEDRVGRILFNGWPTGVEVSHAMVHGGPFPATSAPGTTSVGSLAIARFQRPVSYQNVPEDLLPEPVAAGNPWQLTRRVDGVLQVSEQER